MRHVTRKVALQSIYQKKQMFKWAVFLVMLKKNLICFIYIPERIWKQSVQHVMGYCQGQVYAVPFWFSKKRIESFPFLDLQVQI